MKAVLNSRMALFGRCLAAALLLGTFCAPARADNSDVQCFKDQWVLSVSEIPALRAKAFDAIQDVSSKPLDVADATARAMLVTSLDQAGDAGDRLDAPIVPYQSRSDLCMKMREAAREELREQRISGKSDLLRRFSCGCNEKVELNATPNDPNFALQWALHQSGNIDMNLPEAWNLYTGSATTVVAVIDTGVDYTHSDLSANMWRNESDPPNGIDDDQNGFIDDYYGINAVSRSGDPYDDHGHGTHVSGSIGAATNNGRGVAGVNWDVKIMGCKFLSSSGSGSIYDAMTCVDYVTTMKNRGVNVILSSNSWGGGGYWQPFYDALARARSAGVLFVAAAGNASNNNDTNPYYPCGYKLDNVISVAAVDSSGALAYFSSYGANSVHIGAPGVNILSTYPGERYATMSGTSMATPHISGVLALLYSYAPYLTWQDLKNNLLSTGKSLPALAGKTITGKMADAYAMLQAVGTPDPNRPTPTPRPTSTPVPTPVPTSTPTPVPTPTITPTPVPGYWSLTGVVLIGNVPLAGARVKLITSNGTFYRVTNSEGRAPFENMLGPGSFTMEATASGYHISTASGYFNQDSQVELYGFARTFNVKVKVLDKDKLPLGGVQIQTGNETRITDPSGRVIVPVTYGSNYTFSASLSGYTFNTSSVSGTVYGDVDRVIVALPE